MTVWVPWQAMRVPPPLLALGAGLAQRALTKDPQRPGAFRAAVAGTTGAASMLLARSSARSLGEAGTSLNPVDPTQASVLVTTGANAVTRNPMYLGLTGLLLANAIRLRSWRALVPATVFVLLIDRLQIPAEETALSARFGEDYEAYRRAVPRWLDGRSVGSRL